jgi:hypothetical protein
MANVSYFWRRVERFRIGEILFWWLARVFFTRKSKSAILDISCEEIGYLAFVSGSQFQSFDGVYSQAEKVDPILDSLDKSGWHGIRFFHPFSTLPQKNPFKRYLQCEGVLNFSLVIQIILNIESIKYDSLFNLLNLQKKEFTQKILAVANFELFKMFMPRMIIGIGLTEIQVAIAHSLGIPCIELQHGGFFERTPIKRTNHRLNPDLFLVWDSDN